MKDISLERHINKCYNKNICLRYASEYNDFFLCNLSVRGSLKKYGEHFLIVTYKDKMFLTPFFYINFSIIECNNKLFLIGGANGPQMKNGGIYIKKIQNPIDTVKNFSENFKYNLSSKTIVQNYELEKIIEKKHSLHQADVRSYYDAAINMIHKNGIYYIYARYNPQMGHRKIQVFQGADINNLSSGQKVNFEDKNINLYSCVVFQENNNIYGFFAYYIYQANEDPFYRYKNMKIMLAESFDFINFKILNDNLIKDYNFYTHGFIINSNNISLKKFSTLSPIGNYYDFYFDEKTNMYINKYYNITSNCYSNIISKIQKKLYLKEKINIKNLDTKNNFIKKKINLNKHPKNEDKKISPKKNSKYKIKNIIKIKTQKYNIKKKFYEKKKKYRIRKFNIIKENTLNINDSYNNQTDNDANNDYSLKTSDILNKIRYLESINLNNSKYIFDKILLYRKEFMKLKEEEKIYSKFQENKTNTINNKEKNNKEKTKNNKEKTKNIKKNIKKNVIIKKDVIKKNVIKKDVSKKNVIKKNVVKKDIVKKDVIKKDIVKKNIKKNVIIKKDVIKKNEIKKNEIKKNEIKKNEIKKNEIKKNEIKKNEIKKNVIKKNVIKKNVIKKNVIKKNEIKKDVIKNI